MLSRSGVALWSTVTSSSLTLRSSRAFAKIFAGTNW
jgi:hypothetical protein